MAYSWANFPATAERFGAADHLKSFPASAVRWTAGKQFPHVFFPPASTAVCLNPRACERTRRRGYLDGEKPMRSRASGAVNTAPAAPIQFRIQSYFLSLRKWAWVTSVRRPISRGGLIHGHHAHRRGRNRAHYPQRGPQRDLRSASQKSSSFTVRRLAAAQGRTPTSTLR